MRFDVDSTSKQSHTTLVVRPIVITTHVLVLGKRNIIVNAALADHKLNT